jgi:hypothetical protein
MKGSVPAKTFLRSFVSLGFCLCFSAALPARAEVIGIKWARQYDGTNYPSLFGPADSFDQGRAVALDSAGNAFVAARSDGFHVSKYSGESGALLWEKRVGTGSNFSDAAVAIATNANGDVIASGVLGTDFYTAKYAGVDGKLLWEQRYNGIGNDSDAPTHLAIDSNGNAIVTGHTIAFSKGEDVRNSFGDIIHIPPMPDIYTVKYDGVDGHIIWQQRYDGPAQDYDYPAGLGLDPSGNVIVTGASARMGADGSPDIDIYTVKYGAPTGTVLWERRADRGSYDSATGLAVDRFGNAVVNGSLGEAQTIEASYTVKYSGANGSVLWERNGAPGSVLSLGSIAADFDGNLLVTGSYKEAGNANYAQDAYVAKFAGNDGRILWEKKYPNSHAGPWAGGGSAARFDSAGNVVVGGAVAISTSPYKWRLFAAAYSGIDGSTIWEKIFSSIGPQYEETFGGLALDAEGSAFLTGTLFPRPTGDDVELFVVKLGPVGQLLNISSRMQVETGEKVAIGGFIIVGPENQTKKILIRGLGPSLAAADVSGILQDSTLELRLAGGTVVRNNNWKESQRAEIEATGIPPSHESESAIVANLPPGAHTVVLRGNNNGSGVGLVELYDLEEAGLTNLGNISTRGQVATGDNVMITGFIVGGNRPAKMLVRALGPSLTSAGVSGAMQDPNLELHDQNGVALSNDDWRSAQESEIIATGAAPTNDQESAIVATLAPGPYTAIVRGANDTFGIALVEAYNLQ